MSWQKNSDYFLQSSYRRQFRHIGRRVRLGAREAGHDVDTIRLADKAIGFCRGCLACQRTRRCVIHDDADAIAQRMKDADVLVFATPIYFYAVCGQLKTLLDRTNPLFPSDYAFRDVYLLATAADGDERAVDGAVKEIQGWIDCFEKRP